MATAASTFDLIIDTVPVKHDLDPYVPLLDVDGTLVIVGQIGPMNEMNTVPLLLGRRLPDTQCGFRVLSRRFAEAVVSEVAGGRYETEMEIIVKALREGYTVGHSPIRTLYEAGNPSSHFHKLRDSFLIYVRLLRTVLRRRHPRGAALR